MRELRRIGSIGGYGEATIILLLNHILLLLILHLIRHLHPASLLTLLILLAPCTHAPKTSNTSILLGDHSFEGRVNLMGLGKSMLTASVRFMLTWQKEVKHICMGEEKIFVAVGV